MKNPFLGIGFNRGDFIFLIFTHSMIQYKNSDDHVLDTNMKTEELSGKRKRAPTKTFVSAESQKKMRVSKRDKGKVQYNTVSIHHIGNCEISELFPKL